MRVKNQANATNEKARLRYNNVAREVLAQCNADAGEVGSKRERRLRAIYQPRVDESPVL